MDFKKKKKKKKLANKIGPHRLGTTRTVIFSYTWARSLSSLTAVSHMYYYFRSRRSEHMCGSLLVLGGTHVLSVLCAAYYFSLFKNIFNHDLLIIKPRPPGLLSSHLLITSKITGGGCFRSFYIWAGTFFTGMFLLRARQ